MRLHHDLYVPDRGPCSGTRFFFFFNDTATTEIYTLSLHDASPNGLCDPRGIGLNSQVSQIWNKQMPLPNDFTTSGGDTFNTQGYLTSLKLPQNDNFGVVRLDHGIGSKWTVMSSYRYYHLERAVDNQFDIGGVLGGTFGVAKSTANR